LFLCYNAFLCEFLVRNNVNKNIDIFNVDSFVSECCGKDAGTSENRIIAYRSINIEDFSYDDIIIDEAQDLGNDEILFFKELCYTKGMHCLIFYDKNQMVLYNNKEDIKNEFEQFPWVLQSECKLLLSKNCRNTMEIAKTAYSVIDYDVERGLSNISGSKPTISFVEENGLLSKLLELIYLYLSYGFKKEDMVILTMKSEQKSTLKNIESIGAFRLKSTYKDEGILFTSARKFKGLESKVIIIVDIDEKCFLDKQTKNAFYVACSRATHNLSMLVEGDSKKIRTISDAIPGMGFSNKGKIVMKTKTKLC